jgi:ribosomal protein L37AE/L43A
VPAVSPPRLDYGKHLWQTGAHGANTVTASIECPFCEQSFTTPDKATASWFFCAHCGGRTPNLARLVGYDAAEKANNFVGFAGMVLLVIGLVGMACASMLPAFSERLKKPFESPAWTFWAFGGFGLITASGAVFFHRYRLGQKGGLYKPQLRLATMLLLAALMVVALAFWFCF